MSLVPVPTYESAEEMRAAYAARRARLMTRARSVVAPIQARPAAKIQASRLREAADAHVLSYREYLARVEGCRSPTSYVRLRCEMLDVPYDLLMSETRTAELVSVRQQLIREVRVGYPKLTTDQLGWVFERQRSAIYHALKNKVPNWVRLPQAKIDEIRRLHAKGMSAHAIRKALGVGDETVHRYVDENYNERVNRLKRERRRKAKSQESE